MLKDLFRNVDFLFRVFHESTSIVFVLTDDLCIYDSNVAVSTQLGYGHAMIRSKCFPELIWEEEQKDTEKILKKAIKKRENIKKEFYIVDREGEVKLISFKGFVYENEEDKRVYYILIGDDITKVKLLEQSEMVEYQKFQSLFNSPGVGIALIDLNSIFLDVNNTFCDMVGYSRNELLKMFVNKLLYKESSFYFEGVKAKLIAGSKFEQFEIQYKRKDEFIMWAFVSVVLHTVADNPMYYVATIQDISDKKYLEIKSRENALKYRLLFNRSFSAIAYKKLIYDNKGNIQDYLIMDANPTFERVTGLKIKDIVGRPMKIKAQEHFKVTYKENFSRLQRYDRIIKDGKDVHFKYQQSRTFKNPIDVYYYIVDQDNDLFAVVFGDIDDGKLVMNL